jgi:hypothetical protein
MCGRVGPPKARHAVMARSLARDSDSSPEASEVPGGGFNRSVARSALHARGRIWVKGRIAECPRLQQIGRTT